MQIYSITNIDSAMQMFEVDMIIRQKWEDHRLNFTEQSNTNYTMTIKYEDIIGNIWIPDLFVSNAKTTKHQSRVDNKDLAQVLRISPGGKIEYTNRLALEVFCDMNLHKFPADKQKCKIVVESYGDPEDAMSLAWIKEECPVLFEGKYGSPQFDMIGHCPQVSTSDIYYTGKKFTALETYIVFCRRVTSYIFTVYIPAAMIVFLSTVSFWVRPGSVPARVALGITTVLSEATVMSGSLNAYPTVSYLKALDLYTMVCFCFTFCVLIEYAIVHIMVNKKMYHHHQDRGLPEDDDEDEDEYTGATINVQKTVDSYPASWTPTSNLKFESSYANKNGFPLKKVPSRSFQAIFDPNLPPDKRQNYRRKPKTTEEEKRIKERQLLMDFVSPLDTVSRVLFPLAFVIFNIFYFLWIMDTI
ncbi:glycine receptor subunit alpha-2-like [Dendronephthya gigantea]|uniref:glycine receptor subunit alpha-2-like n=1 Tax=Dendronephthya gigantea TaxID=151771 RepID=UPI00106AA8BF|nr:glycine receptor subunit alpha-2-like [Dendronephthya gigantea]